MDETTATNTTESEPQVQEEATPEVQGERPEISKEEAKGKATLFDEPEAAKPEDTKEGTSEDTKEDKEAEPSEEKKEGEAAPLTAEDITVPEGFTYDAELGDGFLAVVNDTSLSRKERIQKLVDLHAAQMGKAMEALQAADAENMKKFEADVAKEKADWLEQCKADKEFGGASWEASDAVIDRGCKQLATPEAIKLLQRYNLNTHPEIVRMFFRAGKLVGEDTSGSGSSGVAPSDDAAERIFGESLKGLKGVGTHGI